MSDTPGSALQIRPTFLEAEREKWLSVDEAAYVLHTTRNKIFRLLDTKRLRHFRDGRVIRIHIDDLHALTEAPST